MIDTKKEFLRSLRFCLFFRMSPAEAREVAADYETFFDDKLGEGKSEAEVCREFGSPREVAKAILKEEGKNSKPLGALALVWTVLGIWFLREWGMPFFSLYNDERLYSLIVFLMTPLLWLLWRKSIYPAQPPRRGRFVALCAIPVVLSSTFCTYVCYIVRYPEQLQEQIEENLYRGTSFAYFIDLLANLGELAIAVVLLLCLLWAWGKSPWYLPPAAHAFGCIEAIEQTLFCMKRMDLSLSSIYDMQREFLLRPLGAYLTIALGGTALTAFLVWKGGRRGRAAQIGSN